MHRRRDVLSSMDSSTHTTEAANLLELTPARQFPYETGEDGLVTVLVPKFRNRFLARTVLPFLAHPNFRVKLDAVGSHIWSRCDGATPVGAIAESLRERFGDAVEPVEGRIAKFLQHLERGDLLSVSKS